MKKLLTIAVAVALLGLVSAESRSAGKIAIGVGPDVLLPIGSFGDAYNVGFGGTARGQYMVNEQFSVIVTAGYLTFSVKNVPSGVSFDNATMIPIVAGGKYYFTPSGSMRFYGIAEIGITSFKQSLGGSVGGQSFNFGSVTSTEFTYAPGIGFEADLGGGNTKIDVGVRWNGISDANSIGGRVGILFGLGN
jgi:hypothetical protein